MYQVLALLVLPKSRREAKLGIIASAGSLQHTRMNGVSTHAHAHTLWLMCGCHAPALSAESYASRTDYPSMPCFNGHTATNIV